MLLLGQRHLAFIKRSYLAGKRDKYPYTTLLKITSHETPKSYSLKEKSPWRSVKRARLGKK